jgi:hypothetical protein
LLFSHFADSAGCDCPALSCGETTNATTKKNELKAKQIDAATERPFRVSFIFHLRKCASQFGIWLTISKSWITPPSIGVDSFDKDAVRLACFTIRLELGAFYRQTISLAPHYWQEVSRLMDPDKWILALPVYSRHQEWSR